jgi:hypothetical protein
MYTSEREDKTAGLALSRVLYTHWIDEQTQAVLNISWETRRVLPV